MYIKALGAFFSKMFSYKSGALALSSTGIAAVVEFIAKGEFMGVSVAFLLLISLLYVWDFVTGVAASRSEGENVKSSKITYTIAKFLALGAWICISYQIQCSLGESQWVQFLVSAIATFPLVLMTLREFISIGENIERRHGNKPYIFRLVEKIFDAVEALLLKRIEAVDTAVK